MTPNEEKDAAHKLRLAIDQKEYYEKILKEAGFSVDYREDGTIVYIKKNVIVEL